jgi:hypothetical protein
LAAAPIRFERRAQHPGSPALSVGLDGFRSEVLMSLCRLFFPLCGLVVSALLPACSETHGQAAPPGQEKSARTQALEAGARLLQSSSPLAPMDIHLVGLHPLKANPGHQMEAHHFCRQVNEDFAQCVLFDGDSRDANLNGIEYIISEKLFETLPDNERRLWHPHNYEILAGQLVAPGLPGAAEKALMRSKMNSYGKTWHVWNTGRTGAIGDRLPLGEAMLAWSFNRDGEAEPGLLEGRDRRLGIDARKKRQERADLLGLAKPQVGVDTLKGRFGRPTTELPGVQDRAAR